MTTATITMGSIIKTMMEATMGRAASGANMEMTTRVVESMVVTGNTMLMDSDTIGMGAGGITVKALVGYGHLSAGFGLVATKMTRTISR
jgi:hypothetical protein